MDYINKYILHFGENIVELPVVPIIEGSYVENNGERYVLQSVCLTGLNEVSYYFKKIQRNEYELGSKV